jgi:glucokinase
MDGAKDLVGAVDVGGTKIAVGLVSASGAILEQEVSPTRRDKGFDTGLEAIQEMLDRCLRRYQQGHPDAHLLGVGVGCTGPVDPATGILGPNSFLPLWEGVQTVDRMQQALGLPVAIENDADAAALGEAAWGAGREASRCLYVTVSTGIGCGLVIDGHLYRGAGGAHPELGHVIIDSSGGPACYCGGRGCWESLASGTALAAWYLDQRRDRGTPVDPAAAPDARVICRMAGEGETLAQEAVIREGYYLGIGLANLITSFIPDVIVLGGGVMESWSLFEGQALSVIRQTCGLVPFERTALRRAALGAQTGLVGAARVWFHHFAGPGATPSSF